MRQHIFLPSWRWNGKRYRCRFRFLNRFKFAKVVDDYGGCRSVVRWWFANVLFVAMIDKV